MDSSGYKCLIFVVGGDEYAMPICKIREIIGYVPVIPFSKKQGVFQGIVLWEEELVPVLDLRVTISGGSGLVTSKTCIIILELPLDGESLLAGVIVDGVCDIIDLPPAGGCDLESSLSAHTPRLSWGSSAGRSSSVFVRRGPRFGRP